jgi:hypothetical protein
VVTEDGSSNTFCTEGEYEEEEVFACCIKATLTAEENCGEDSDVIRLDAKRAAAVVAVDVTVVVLLPSSSVV